MSQSDEHRLLVLKLSEALVARHPGIFPIVDVQAAPGDAVPEMIDGHRPDLYAQLPNSAALIIGEAKTPRDIDNEHTRSQIRTFIAHLDQTQGSRLILATTGQGANSAKTLLRFMQMEDGRFKTRIQVFDTCDFWTLDSQTGVLWLLD